MPTHNRSLVDDVVESLLERVVTGKVPVGSALPPESEISTEMGVSRLTTREAVKILRAQNIVQVRRGIGTYVNSPSKWTNLEAVLRSLSQGVDSGEVALRLLEARRIVETGAAELAAARHDEDDLAAMSASIDDMERAQAEDDIAKFTAADIAFHDAVLAASGNPFVPALLGGLSPLLYRTRIETSAFPEIQSHALAHHRRLLTAIASRDAARAREAMQQHINQTYDDYAHFLSVQ